jgi:DNA invertase Pin-like site-specific DNA recombinase
MKIGYARVSTDDQNSGLQLDALKKAGCQKIYVDKASGAKRQHPELNKCLAAPDADDVLIVWKLDPIISLLTRARFSR